MSIILIFRHIFLVRAGGGKGWHVEWAVRLDDLLGVPVATDGKLVLNIKQVFLLTISI